MVTAESCAAAKTDCETEGRALALCDEAAALCEAGDIGGNHHNDKLSFDYAGRTYEYYHSSFGFGWRQCQPMDCLQVRDASGALLEDGCTDERTLPVHCSQVNEDGSYEPVEVDDFTQCQGDSD